MVTVHFLVDVADEVVLVYVTQFENVPSEGDTILLELSGGSFFEMEVVSKQWSINDAGREVTIDIGSCISDNPEALKEEFVKSGWKIA